MTLTGGKFGPEVRLFWLAALFLTIGIVVYAVDRGGAVYFLPDWLATDGETSIFGTVGDRLPTFVHTLAFILITAAVLWPWPRSLPAICAGWFALECLFEIGQHEVLGQHIAAAVPGWFDGLFLLEATPAYFTSGTFDWLDILAIGLGAVAAYLLVRKIREGGMP
ncbi:MAG: hypothetical protein KJO76_11355 [Gammaproteobacteria bacterium]|nr:hypothetical protein [Gammaproteobacteria bacterium]MBT8443921.1 hypothetical protein [Gammaproteobacteria bacterium]NND36789.1 hypothetical protein [Gammaproteobacteria bacterium]